MESLNQYADRLMAAAKVGEGKIQFFAKFLTRNDDSGRHGILLPSDAYEFFPEFKIDDLSKNQTIPFKSYDFIKGVDVDLSYKYYERYPERRLTCVNGIVNRNKHLLRLQIFLRVENLSGEVRFVHDAYSGQEALTRWLEFVGQDAPVLLGSFAVLPVGASEFRIDEPLQALLDKFDVIKGGWFESMRSGSTGIGFTFETLMGIEENNDPNADFRGIEIKCKRKKMKGNEASGKLNLFQQGPIWTRGKPIIEVLRGIGYIKDGRLACHSQINTTANNLNLRLSPQPELNRIEFIHGSDLLAHWANETLANRLSQKHSRAVFVKAEVREINGLTSYRYDELVYCEKPHIDRFLNLLCTNQLVVEFLMSEKPPGQVRNRGYPWRLNSESLLDQLFAMKIQLRQ